MVIFRTVPKVIDFPRHNTKCSGENEIPRGIVRVVFRFSLHFMLYLEKLDYFLDSVEPPSEFGHNIRTNLTGLYH